MSTSKAPADEPAKPAGYGRRVFWGASVMLLCASLWVGFARHKVPSTVLSTRANPISTAVQGWRRIRLRTYDDIEKSFDAITDIIQHPEQAELLEELVFDRTLHGYGNAWCFDTEGDDGAGRFINEGLLPLNEKWSTLERQIEERVRNANLPSDLKAQITRAMVWKSQHRNPEVSGTSKASNWMYRRDAEHHEYAEAAFTLLAAVAPNLKTLSTVEPTGTASKFLHAANRNRTKAPSLTQLTTVKLLTGDDVILNDERFYNKMSLFSTLRHFDHLPAIETVSIQTIEIGDELGGIPPGLSPIKSISATHSALSSSEMCTLIRMAEKLASVKFSSGGRCILGGYTMSVRPSEVMTLLHPFWRMIYPKSLGKCLEQHKATLHTIDLDTDQYLWSNPHQPEGLDAEQEDGKNRHARYEDEDWDDNLLQDPDWTADQMESVARGYVSHSRDLPDTKPYGETIGSFSDFHELHTLRIGIKLLLGPERYDAGPKNTWPVGLIDMMPSSLRTLEVRGYVKGFNKDWDEEITQFLQLQPTGLPNLINIKGLLEHIPSGEDVENPDSEEDLLFVVPEEDDGWLWA